MPCATFLALRNAQTCATSPNLLYAKLWHGPIRVMSFDWYVTKSVICERSSQNSLDLWRVKRQVLDSFSTDEQALAVKFLLVSCSAAVISLTDLGHRRLLTISLLRPGLKYSFQFENKILTFCNQAWFFFCPEVDHILEIDRNKRSLYGRVNRVVQKFLRRTMEASRRETSALFAKISGVFLLLTTLFSMKNRKIWNEVTCSNIWSCHDR